VTVELTREGAVTVATWDDGENRVNVDSVAALTAALDEVEGRPAPRALVLTGVGKFFSNGLDLERFGSDMAELTTTLDTALALIARLAVAPYYSVAALNGHTFAAGALLSMGFDYRVMREDRGYWCMNEAEIGLPLDRRLFAVLEHRLPRATAVHAALTAQRYPGPDAVAAGIVEEAVPESVVLERAVEVAAARAGLDPGVLATHKRLIHGRLAEALGVAL
jgi:enoyl-CoA hydratase/carnithine racemase